MKRFVTLWEKNELGQLNNLKTQTLRKQLKTLKTKEKEKLYLKDQQSNTQFEDLNIKRIKRIEY